MTGKATTENKQTENPAPQPKPKANPAPQPAARVGYTVEAQMIFPRARNEGEKAEEYQAYRDKYEADPDYKCTVVKHVRWPNGDTDQDTFTLAENCKIGQVREWQKDSAAAAAAIGQ